MKMTCVNRLNYNYYYLVFDVVRQSNYKMLKRELGKSSFQSYKNKFMLVEKFSLFRYLMSYSK